MIYAQRRRVLEGDDMSDEMRAWIDEVVERIVANYTGDEYEQIDLDALCQAMSDLYGSDVTPDELREEVALEPQALTEEFQDDAKEAYDDKEQELGAELMRELERFVTLQVVDTRWREHLENMDYLREGVHLRAFAQKDPLVEYRGEGHAMFEELSAAIREEVVGTLFHAQLAPEAPAPRAAAGRRRRQPLVRVRDHRGPGRDHGRRPRRWRRFGRDRRRAGRCARADRLDHEGAAREPEARPQRPVLVRFGQEVQEVPRRLTDEVRRGYAAP